MGSTLKRRTTILQNTYPWEKKAIGILGDSELLRDFADSAILHLSLNYFFKKTTTNNKNKKKRILTKMDLASKKRIQRQAVCALLFSKPTRWRKIKACGFFICCFMIN